MNARAAVILIQQEKLALIERQRAGQQYFVFPGGQVEPGETPEGAAVRETMEELGLQVAVQRLVVVAESQGKVQYYFLAQVLAGTFGTGKGEEMTSPRPEKGSYHPLWMAFAELAGKPIKPDYMPILLERFLREGWPDQPVTYTE